MRCVVGSISHDEGTKEMFYLTTHSTHFIYGYMASDPHDEPIKVFLVPDSASQRV